jgi:hypothetical protein
MMHSPNHTVGINFSGKERMPCTVSKYKAILSSPDTFIPAVPVAAAPFPGEFIMMAFGDMSPLECNIVLDQCLAVLGALPSGTS